jgi:hypothetical protein
MNAATSDSTTRNGDPLVVVWHALDRLGCEPHGPEHDFRARCPAHDGRTNSSLHVIEGADRRAVLHCFNGCKPEAVVAALDLRWADLFPAGHRRAARVRIERSRLSGNAARVADVLAALEVANRPWRLSLAVACPYCEHPAAWLRGGSDGRLHFDCPDGCGVDSFAGALAARVVVTR